MPIEDTFEFPGEEFINQALVHQYPGRDFDAIRSMRTLASTMHGAPHLTYARGSWGYTIFRTVFTEESDRLFPLVMEKLQRWLTQYCFHKARFPLWGKKGQEQHNPNGMVNDEIAHRFQVDIIEEKELDIPALRHASAEDINRLCGRFRKWVIGVGGDPDCRNDKTNPRMQLFLAIDSECLEELAALPDDPPPLCIPETHQEYVRLIRQRSGFLWLFDYQAIQNYNPDEDPVDYRGWMKLDILEVEGAWFCKARGLKEDQRIIECREAENTDGTICYVAHGANF